MKTIHFGTWDDSIHSEPDQVKRIESAKKAACTPISIDKETLSGKFQGSSGSYDTTLDKCRCVDFSRRKEPCKHMYRLAMELGFIECQYKTDSSQIAVPKKKGIKLEDAAEIIDKLPVPSQELLLGIIYDMKYAKLEKSSVPLNSSLEHLINAGIVIIDYDEKYLLHAYRRNELNARIDTLNIKYKKNMKLEDLIVWCLDNIKDEIKNICPERTTVILSEQYSPTMHKIYKYLNRQYGYDSYINEHGEDVSIPYIKTVLPDDDVTALLIKRGKYKNN